MNWHYLNYRMQGWPRSVGGQVMERLNMASGPRANRRRKRREAGKPLGGGSRGRSVEARPQRCAGWLFEDARAGLLPHEYHQLAKGAQENAPQHSDASPALNEHGPQSRDA
jgi:hypothetical protein